MSLSSQYWSSSSLFSTLQHYFCLIDLQRAKPLHALIIKTGSFSCVYVAKALISLYVKSGHLLNARLVFQTTPHKDVVSSNTLINAYSHHQHSSLVFELFRQMQAQNCSTDSHTFARLLNVASWAIMISGYAMHKLAVDAVELFALMRRSERREEENEFVLITALSGLTTSEFVDTVKQIHCLMLKNGFICVVSVGNALVTMYAKCGSLDDALRTFVLCGVKNSITWSAIIFGLTQSSDSQKALDFFSDMHYSGMMSNEFPFGVVVIVCSDISVRMNTRI